MKFSLIKKWLFHAKCLTTLVWIIFPFFYILFAAQSYWRGPFFGISYYYLVISNNPIPLVIPSFPLLIWLLFFAVYPAIYPTHKFYSKRGSENVVIEYAFLKKILYCSILIVIFAIILTQYIIMNMSQDNEFKELTEQYTKRLGPVPSGKTIEEMSRFFNEAFQKDPELEKLNSEIGKRYETIIQSLGFTSYSYTVIFYSIYFIAVVPISILIKLLLEHARSKFRISFARACFDIVLKKTSSNLEKARYLELGLRWYNMFLKRNIGLQFDYQAVYSRILLSFPLNNNQCLTQLIDSFKDEDDFKPLRHISENILNKSQDILVEQNIMTRIKESSDLLIPLITIIITIISTFFLKPPSLP